MKSYKKVSIVLGSCLLLNACAGVNTANVPVTHYAKYKANEYGNTGIKLNDITTVNNYVNHLITYKNDAKGADIWQAPKETLHRKAGDCEDYAILKRQIILENNLALPEDIKILLIWDIFRNEPHAVLSVKGNILNNQTDKIHSVNSDRFRNRYRILTIAEPK